MAILHRRDSQTILQLVESTKHRVITIGTLIGTSRLIRTLTATETTETTEAIPHQADLITTKVQVDINSLLPLIKDAVAMTITETTILQAVAATAITTKAATTTAKEETEAEVLLLYLPNSHLIIRMLLLMRQPIIKGTTQP